MKSLINCQDRVDFKVSQHLVALILLVLLSYAFLHFRDRVSKEIELKYIKGVCLNFSGGY